MDAGGTITKLKNAPIELGIRQTIVTVDPVSGKFLVFAKNGDYYEFDAVNDSWTKKGVRDLKDSYGDLNTVATPISNYGVVMLVVGDFSNSKVYVYKHTN
jgi:hypothetical protein